MYVAVNRWNQQICIFTKILSKGVHLLNWLANMHIFFLKINIFLVKSKMLSLILFLLILYFDEYIYLQDLIIQT